MAAAVGFLFGLGLLYFWLTGRWFAAVIVALIGMAFAKDEAASTQIGLYMIPWVPFAIKHIYRHAYPDHPVRKLALRCT